MEKRAKSTPPVHTESDIDVEEFARQFFGTDQDYEHCSSADSVPTYHEKYSHRNKVEKDKKKQRREETNGGLKQLNTSALYGSDVNLKNNSRKTPKQPLEGRKTSEHKQSVRDDFKEGILSRFLKLRDEFLFLSKRLDRVKMEKVSKRLTQVLAERQRLMAMLFETETPAYESHSVRPRDHNQKDFGMLKKTKNVHWSDDCLGGSIVQDPTVNVKEPTDQEPVLKTSTPHPWKNLDCRRHEDSKILPNVAQIIREWPKEAYHSGRAQSSPTYEMVDSSTQTDRRRESRTESRCDMSGNLCTFGIGHAIGCVEDIVSEAAALRREACSMLWRAYYLEQLCDPNGIVKHVFYSPSDLPELPRYPHLH